MKQEIQQASMKLIAETGLAIYCDDRIAFIENIKMMKNMPQAIRTEVILAILCLQGKGQLDLDGDTHTIEADDLLICHPNIIIGKAWPASTWSTAASPFRPNTSASWLS